MFCTKWFRIQTVVESSVTFEACYLLKFVALVYRKEQKQNGNCSSNRIANSCCSASYQYGLSLFLFFFRKVCLCFLWRRRRPSREQTPSCKFCLHNFKIYVNRYTTWLIKKERNSSTIYLNILGFIMN